MGLGSAHPPFWQLNVENTGRLSRENLTRPEPGASGMPKRRADCPALCFCLICAGQHDSKHWLTFVTRAYVGFEGEEPAPRMVPPPGTGECCLLQADGFVLPCSRHQRERLVSHSPIWGY